MVQGKPGPRSGLVDPNLLQEDDARWAGRVTYRIHFSSCECQHFGKDDKVEKSVEAPLRTNLQQESGLLWDNTKSRLDIPGQKALRNNPQLFQNWVDTRDAWLWRGSGI